VHTSFLPIGGMANLSTARQRRYEPLGGPPDNEERKAAGEAAGRAIALAIVLLLAGAALLTAAGLQYTGRIHIQPAAVGCCCALQTERCPCNSSCAVCLPQETGLAVLGLLAIIPGTLGLQ
jgi:hypothetical protein